MKHKCVKDLKVGDICYLVRDRLNAVSGRSNIEILIVKKVVKTNAAGIPDCHCITFSNGEFFPYLSGDCTKHEGLIMNLYFDKASVEEFIEEKLNEINKIKEFLK